MRQKPDTRELHFFSHSFFYGPILANTKEFGSADRKSPLDSDGRPRDFLAPNLENPEQLSKHFAAKAACVIWGCNVTKAWRERIRKLLDATKQDKSVTVNFEFKE